MAAEQVFCLPVTDSSPAPTSGNTGKSLTPSEYFSAGSVSSSNLIASGKSMAYATFTATITGGPWHTESTWENGAIPGSDDHVIIPAGSVVIIGNPATCNDLTINGSLVITGNNSLTMNGSWTNNGTFSANTSTVTFSGAGNATISGTANTAFSNLSVSKGTSMATILEVNTSSAISYMGTLTLNSGLFRLTAGTVNFTGSAGFVIQTNAGIHINGAALTSGNFSITNRGMFQISSGTASIGQIDGNSLQTETGGTLDVSGGTLNIAGRLVNTAGTAIISGGTINLCASGHASSNFASFDMSISTNLTISGGTLIFNRPNNSATNPMDIYIRSGGIKTITGGTFQIGSETTPINSTFRIHSTYSIHNLVINDENNPTLVITGNNLTVNNQLILTGGIIQTGTLALILNNNDPASLQYTSGYVNGNMSRAVAAGTNSYLFPVGTASGYTPATVDIAGASTGGFLTVRSNDGTGPQFPGAMHPSKNLARHWTFSNAGISGFSVNITGQFLSGDLQGGVLPAGLKAYHYSAGVVTYPATTVDPARFTANNMTSFGEFGAAEECSKPEITGITTPEVCFGATQISMTHTATGTPEKFRIEFDAAAVTAGFSAIPWTDIVNPVIVSLPAGLPAGSYTGNLYVGDGLGCDSDPQPFTITINPLNTVQPTSAPGTDGQAACAGTAITPIVYAITGATGAVVSGLPIGVTGDLQTNEVIISGTPTASGTFNYTVTLSGGCGNISTSGSVTVHPTPVLSSASQQDAVCEGTAAVINLSGLLPGSTFSLQYSIDGTNQPDITGLTADVSGNGSFTTPQLDKTAHGKILRISGITITSTSPACMATSDVEVTLQVHSLPADPTSASASSPVICVGAATTLTLNGGGGGTGEVIAWYTGSCGGTMAGTGNNLAVSPTITTTYYGRYETSAPCNRNSACASVTVQVNTMPAFTLCPSVPVALTIPSGSCTATGSYSVTATGIPEPDLIYEFIGATTGSGSGTGSGSAFNVGTTTVRITATNSCGSFDCVFDVVVTDNIPPVISCPADIAENAADNACTREIIVPDPVYSDNCTVTVLTWTMTGATTASSPGSGINLIGTYTFNSGLTTVTYTVRDAAGNSASCSFTVSITDNTPPVIAGCPVDIVVYTGENRMTCNQFATWVAPTATDNCTPNANIIWNSSHTPGMLFPVGTTSVTYTARDASSNVATCSFTVTVIDNTPPNFVVPAATTVYLDNNCLTDVSPSRTGVILNPTDNCTPLANLNISHTDGSQTPGVCHGNYSFVRTWTVTDLNGNSSQKEQTISVVDNIDPMLSRPANISIQCGTSTDPTITGMATAIDVCGGPVNISYSDTQAGNACVFTISRTWVATDACGNSTTGVQQIYVTDTTPPVVQPIATTIINDRNHIPAPDLSVVVATDNCALKPVVFLDEIVYGLENKAGYCPDSIRYIYRVSDGCSNYVDITQLIVIQDPSQCERCLDDVPFSIVDFRNNMDTVYLFEDWVRNSKCCEKTGQTLHCVSFNVVLGGDAVGVQILIDGVTPSGQDWDQDCEELPRNSNGVYCLDPGRFHLFTYCKSGQGIPQRTNTFQFSAIPGIVASESIQTRVECSTVINASAENIQDIRWNSIWPGTFGQYNGYLEFPNGPLNPVFTADAGAPSEIKYQICGYFAGNQGLCYSGSNTCDTISVYVKPPIQIEVDIDTELICEDNIPELTPIISPPADYRLEWFIGTEAIGTPDYTGLTYTPATGGQYVLKVTDLQSGIPCSTEYFPFEVAFDHTGPTFQVVPDTLYVECNSATSTQLILDWLASARATYTDAAGNTVVITPGNDFSFSNFSHSCGNIHPVNFTAFDHCSNDSTRSSAIVVIDITYPIWLDTPGYLDRILSCTDLTGLASANLLEPVYYDDCDPVALLNLVKTQGSFVPSDTCPNAGTYTNSWIVTDACGNSSEVYTQTITIFDDAPPVFTFCPPAIDNRADMDLCLIQDITLEDPVASDLCGAVTITWIKSGATSGSGTGTATGPFNVGVTTITYTATDACGMTDTCVQEVTIYEIGRAHV